MEKTETKPNEKANYTETEWREWLASEIVDCCLTVHKTMGPGLMESIYELCLLKEFELRNIKAVSQVTIPLFYKSYDLNKDFKLDILVDDEIIIELKSSEYMMPIFESQLLSYLKLSNKKIGFLVNFNVPLLKNGIKRYINKYYQKP